MTPKYPHILQNAEAIPKEQLINFMEENWPLWLWKAPFTDIELTLSPWDAFFEHHPELQLVLKDKEGAIIAHANSLPISWTKKLDQLPEEGWSWTLKQVQKENKGAKNILCAMSITVCKNRRGEGLSRMMLKELKNMAKEKGFEHLIVPVRPNHKWKWPLISMQEYIKKTRSDQLCYDPWLRTHQRIGGVILSICSRSMQFSATQTQWNNWLKQPIPKEGSIEIPNMLFPLELKNGHGYYNEANVWVLHPL